MSSPLARTVNREITNVSEEDEVRWKDCIYEREREGEGEGDEGLITSFFLGMVEEELTIHAKSTFGKLVTNSDSSVVKMNSKPFAWRAGFGIDLKEEASEKRGKDKRERTKDQEGRTYSKSLRLKYVCLATKEPIRILKPLKAPSYNKEEKEKENKKYKKISKSPLPSSCSLLWPLSFIRVLNRTPPLQDSRMHQAFQVQSQYST